LDEKQKLEYDNDQHRIHLDAIFRSVADGIVTVKSDFIVASANKAIEKFIGVNPSAIIGRPFAEVIENNKSACISVLQNTLEMKMPVHDFNVEWTDMQNRSQSVVLNSAPLVDRDNNFLGAVLVMRDTTKLNYLEKSLKERQAYHRIVGRSREMQDIYALLDILSKTDTTVLIEGDSGTGKELIADALHYKSPRSQNQLVKVNCSALTDSLLESELFGHVKGAFTGALSDKTGRFQMADGGTVFLDEIGDISPAIQLKLLRFIQEKKFERVGDSRPIEVDVRIVSATNRNLKNEVERGLFREDLYYRLKVVKIAMPPLCRRREDILLIAGHFIERLNRKFEKHICDISDEVRKLFMQHSWPGNVRELEHALEHAFILCQGGTVMREHLPPELQEVMPGG
ncbi:MAG: PAS domain-containing protein, partial [bacterium]|nr:PAS domain-containing protein [bacterium]